MWQFLAVACHLVHKPLWFRIRSRAWWKPELRGGGSVSSPHTCGVPRGGGNIEPGGGGGGWISLANGGGGDLWLKGGSKCGDIGGGEPVLSYLLGAGGCRDIGGGEDNRPPSGGGRWPTSYGGTPDEFGNGGGKYGGNNECK